MERLIQEGISDSKRCANEDAPMKTILVYSSARTNTTSQPRRPSRLTLMDFLLNFRRVIRYHISIISLLTLNAAPRIARQLRPISRHRQRIVKLNRPRAGRRTSSLSLAHIPIRRRHPLIRRERRAIVRNCRSHRSRHGYAVPLIPGDVGCIGETRREEGREWSFAGTGTCHSREISYFRMA